MPKSFEKQIETAGSAFNDLTGKILGHEGLDFTAKVTLLRKMSAIAISDGLASMHSRVKAAASDGGLVGAYVYTAPESKMLPGLFLGYLAGGDPLRLTPAGVTLDVSSGFIAPTSEPAFDAATMSVLPSARKAEEDGMYDIEDTRLSLILNGAYASGLPINPVTRQADEELIKLQGLDRKIGFENDGMPSVIFGGPDVLNVLGIFGEDFYSRALDETHRKQDIAWQLGVEAVS